MRLLVCLALLSCSPAAVNAVCGAGLVTCDGACTAVATDHANCGSCGHACGANEGCVHGSCAPIACQADLVRCGDACVDSATDPANCGGCGRACNTGESCIAGKCVAPCAAPTAQCSGACVNLASDRANCGACGHACGVHEVCSNRICALTCQADLANCNGSCVDLGTDAANCGACGHSCSGTGCIAGQCGGTGGGCGTGLSPCHGTCVDIQTSESDCGSCGHACGSQQSCSAGICNCASGSACGTACVDLNSNSANCGACGHACGSDQTCSDGNCACTDSARSLCGSYCADLTSDPANCNACGHACKLGETCSSSTCGCAPGTEVCPGSGACIDTDTDADNCGGCGIRCDPGQTCVARSCGAETSAFVQVGGDERHSGFNAGETGVPPLTPAWVATLGAGATTPAVIEGGRAFAITGSQLHAVELKNGAEIWSYNFGTVLGGIGWPAAGDRAIFVATSNNSGDTWFRRLERDSGSVGFKLPFGSQWEHYWSPLIVGNKAYIDGGTYGGLYGFDVTGGGSQLFFIGLDQYDSWSAAAFGGDIYTFLVGKLRKHAAAGGTVQATLDLGWTWNGYSMNTSPVFGDTYAYVISPPNLYAVDPATMKQAWAANSNYTRMPSIANGVVYALSSGLLRALNASTGATAWTFAGDEHLAYPAVVAGSHVYVSSANNVYAVNAVTHAQEWTAPVGGWLAIGQGMLLVSTPAGQLAAYRLTQ